MREPVRTSLLRAQAYDQRSNAFRSWEPPATTYLPLNGTKCKTQPITDREIPLDGKA
jgi:hypothetical protein